VSYEVAFFSVVPSPYQRDLFRALAAHPDVRLHVFYLEAASPDSPWPEKPLAPYEQILRGFWFAIGTARTHVNWPLPALDGFDMIVMNTLMSLTGQWLMRTSLRRKPWIFWGERLSRGGAFHRRLATPLHRASGIASIGAFAERDYRERFPEPRHFRIPYFCELDAFLATPRRARDDGKVVFLFCGQMIARKGVDLLLTAFAELSDTAHLLLVGREADLPALLASLPADVRERCEYAGFQPPEELPRFFAQADVFVLPSRYDGWGVVVNQAIGAGLPVICSDMVGAGHDLVDEEVNGLKFPTGDAASLAEKMRRFVSEPALIERWGAASREKARTFTPAVGAAKWVGAFQTVLAR
jgi:glycosyltransferase involved in cell wall biosynthesis